MKTILPLITLLLAISGAHAQSATTPVPTPPAVSRPVTSPPALGVVTGIKVATDSDSVKVQYSPFPGASDYRIYDVTDPHTVKYAGEIFTTVKGVTTGAPNTEIEWNGLTPGKPATLVVQAVDKLGPFPYGNLYDKGNNPMPGMSGMGMLGSNDGATNDGNISTNGQGDSSNNPNVLAQSAPFTVECSGASQLTGSQQFYDNFEGGGTITPTGATGLKLPMLTYNMVTATGHQWAVNEFNCDNRDSSIFLMHNHLMNVTFDGGTPGVPGQPLHQLHGGIWFSPVPVADISNGGILHVTMEVDATFDNDDRRYVGIGLTPAADPIANWAQGTPINKSNVGEVLEIYHNVFTLDQFTGVGVKSVRVFGAAGQDSVGGKVVGRSNGHGLDGRSRFDLFISTTHVAFYEDGKLIGNDNLIVPLSFTSVHVSYGGFCYHSALGLADTEKNQPYATNWINNVPYSDERHWDNLAYEVLPSTTPWASLAALAQPPAFVAP